MNSKVIFRVTNDGFNLSINTYKAYLLTGCTCFCFSVVLKLESKFDYTNQFNHLTELLMHITNQVDTYTFQIHTDTTGAPTRLDLSASSLLVLLFFSHSSATLAKCRLRSNTQALGGCQGRRELDVEVGAPKQRPCATGEGGSHSRDPAVAIGGSGAWT